MDKSGIVINGLIGPKLIRDYFTTGQSTKKHSMPNEFWKENNCNLWNSYVQLIPNVSWNILWQFAFSNGLPLYGTGIILFSPDIK